MTKKWFEVNMNNSWNKSFYGKQREKDLQEMFKFYKENGDISPPQPDCDAIFCDNFELGWLSSNNFISEYSENFDSTWFVSNNYISIYKDEFKNSWFVINIFVNQANEDFEGVDWNE